MLNLRINENGAQVETIINGISYWRDVDITTFVRLLNNVVLDIKEEEIISPIFPLNTLGYRESKASNAYSVIMYREPRIAGIIFEDRTYKVGYPGIVYVFQVANNILTSAHLHAVKELPKPDTQLFRYPYFNSYEDGRICMGCNRIEIEEPWQLHKIPGIITTMPGNNGLPASNQSGLLGDSLLKAVENKPFPEEWLTPTNKQLKHLF